MGVFEQQVYSYFTVLSKENEAKHANQHLIPLNYLKKRQMLVC